MEEIHPRYCPKPRAARRISSLLMRLTTPIHHLPVTVLVHRPDHHLVHPLKAIEVIPLRDFLAGLHEAVSLIHFCKTIFMVIRMLPIRVPRTNIRVFDQEFMVQQGYKVST
jgi:hypothetical protein